MLGVCRKTWLGEHCGPRHLKRGVMQNPTASSPGLTKGVCFDHDYGVRLWSGHWVLADGAADFQTFEYENLPILAEWLSRVYTFEVLGCRYPSYFSMRVCAYLFDEIKIPNVQLICVFRDVLCCQAADVVTAPHRRMLPRVTTSSESRIRVVLMDTLGDSMSRVSGDVPFAEYECGRRDEVFHGYEYQPESYTRVIPLPKYSSWGLHKTRIDGTLIGSQSPSRTAESWLMTCWGLGHDSSTQLIAALFVLLRVTVVAC